VKQRIALITGGSGQIGSYQAKFLLGKNYKIFITTRGLKKENNLKKLKILNKIKIIKTNLKSKSKVFKLIQEIKPDEIYFYSGISNIQETIRKPKETLIANYDACKNIVEAIKHIAPKCIFFNANSIQIYGNTKNKISINQRKYNPTTPYAKAKLKSFLLIGEYRKKFRLNLFNGLFLNTESILRPKYYVISKICYFVAKFENKLGKKLVLGDVNIKRDWGWCEEYVKIVWKYIQTNPGDFIIGSGKTYSLKRMITMAFQMSGLQWREHVKLEKSLLRKHEINSISANIKETTKRTGVAPKIYGKKLIKKLIDFYKNE